MKTISTAQWQTLEDLSAEGLLGGLPLQIAEKDIHITDLLERLSALEVRHGHFKGLGRNETSRVDDGIKLVFAGGTCLSKAYGLVNRMSEDIDIKVVLGTPSNELKSGVGYTARLKALHAAIESLLTNLNLEIPPTIDDGKNPHIRDVHRYYVVGSRYESKGPQLISLRPELKLEVIHREPRLETSRIEFGYLYERLARQSATRVVAIHCIQIAETLAEKVLSLLRRCAWKWSGYQKGDMDPTLVRHVYDVFRIMTVKPHELASAEDIFKAAVEQDALEFKGQNPDFDNSPSKVLRKTLENARTDKDLKYQYALKLLPLVYEGEHVPYDVAFEKFEEAANELLDKL